MHKCRYLFWLYCGAQCRYGCRYGCAWQHYSINSTIVAFVYNRHSLLPSTNALCKVARHAKHYEWAASCSSRINACSSILWIIQQRKLLVFRHQSMVLLCKYVYTHCQLHRHSIYAHQSNTYDMLGSVCWIDAAIKITRQCS